MICDTCANYAYDEDWECYTCMVNMDEDDFVRFGKRRWEVSKQRLRARIAVRLEKNTQDSAADLPRHRDCTRHLRRVVRVVGVYAVY